MFNKKWWKAVGVRTLRTMAQVAAAQLVIGEAGLLDVDWINFLSVVLLSGIVCVIMSLTGLPEAKEVKD